MDSRKEEKIKNNFKRNLALGILVLVFVLFFSSSFYFRNFIFDLVKLLAGYIGLNPITGGFIFTVFSALAVIISPLSSIPLVPPMIMVGGKFITFILLMAGWFLGAIIGYAIGCYAGEKILRRYFSLEKVDYYKNKISPSSQFWLVLLFRLAIPSEITGYTLGIIRYNFLKYLLAVFISEVPFALISVYSGGALLESNIAFFTLAILAGVVIVGLSGYILNKELKNN